MVGGPTADIGAAHCRPALLVRPGGARRNHVRAAGADNILSGVAELPAALERHAARQR
jgi:phosphoglycolate phosphatase-like HAD superfamily hydrolase